MTRMFFPRRAGLVLAASIVAFPALPVRAAPAAPDYVVAPTRVSPPQGTFPGVTPFFREPYLLLTKEGHLVTVFMEIPPTNDAHRFGWSCWSDTGSAWSCSPISRGPKGIDFADAWIADTRGDPCPTYGSGLTLAALRASDTNVLQPIAYHSSDFGRTWVGPDLLPWPPAALADGSKVLYNGRTYFGWREFAFLAGQYVSRLGTATDPCQWDQPRQNEDGQDHIKLAATREPSGFAFAGNVGTNVFDFHRFGPDFAARQTSVAAGPVTPVEPLYTFCRSDGTCPTGYEISRTLMYEPGADRYDLLYSDRPSPSNRDDISTFDVFSLDGGATWSRPVQLAGPGADHSQPGSASFEETLVLDQTTASVLAVYYEKPLRDSRTVDLRYRVLQGDGTWSAPVTVDSTPYDTAGGEFRFGDYFGAQARDGILHVVHHPVTPAGTGYISYLAVRYAAPAAAASQAPPAGSNQPSPGAIPFSGGPAHAVPWTGLGTAGAALLLLAGVGLVRRARRRAPRRPGTGGRGG